MVKKKRRKKREQEWESSSKQNTKATEKGKVDVIEWREESHSDECYEGMKERKEAVGRERSFG